ncbi:hypothetical protein PV371_11305 [Streptomyces sp. TX20-6-3]|uniref:hypothetical protein n=1 Tax=Streptomyces sp. TX20-6-3 TaxID=3028705 RepID=UPI0029BDA13E|nr:hypothetical protein [Streptomyces sp. TX20-6-3]MDX2560233.1 hypothetical protein [Streptomyces sp. TX20-6-3]
MRLDLPKLAPAVDRRVPYPPYRIVVTFVDANKKEQRVHVQPRGNFGSLPGAPVALAHSYGRGWQCAPTGCRWSGVL